MDLFDLIGPIMVGPSSSHTAGAVRIGLACRRILGEDVAEAEVTLSGSFAATGSGHGTDRAIIAGLLGMKPDDRRIPESFETAKERALKFSFISEDMPAAHPNTARLRLRGVGGAETDIEAASLGGGRIEIRRIGDMPLSFSAEQPTLIIRNVDRLGIVAGVSSVMAEEKINMASFNVNRSSRGGSAVMVIELDTPLNAAVMERVRALPGVLRAVYIEQD